MDEQELTEEVKELRTIVAYLTVRVAVLENTRALAWQWGTSAGAALAAAVAIGHTVWSML